MTKMIAQAVAIALVPTIRKVVKEEVARGVRRVIRENRNIVEELSEYDVPPARVSPNNSLEESSVASAKEQLAKRAHSRANDILANSFKDDDPYASLIMDAEDPELEEQAKAKQYDNLPMVEVTQQMAAGVQPEQIDYSAMMEKMNI